MTQEEVVQSLNGLWQKSRARGQDEKRERWTKVRLEGISVWRSAFLNISHWYLGIHWGLEFKGGMTYEVWSFFLTNPRSSTSFTARVALGKFYFDGVEVYFEDFVGNRYEIDLSTDEVARNAIDDSLIQVVSLVVHYL